LASLLGCSVGLSDEITAFTLVALGTSLPDTLASKTAAEEDSTADNSIGNVTGSNSVNVFLGLGSPWCIASVYGSSEVQQRSGNIIHAMVAVPDPTLGISWIFTRKVASSSQLLH